MTGPVPAAAFASTAYSTSASPAPFATGFGLTVTPGGAATAATCTGSANPSPRRTTILPLTVAPGAAGPFPAVSSSRNGGSAVTTAASCPGISGGTFGRPASPARTRSVTVARFSRSLPSTRASARTATAYGPGFAPVFSATGRYAGACGVGADPAGIVSVPVSPSTPVTVSVTGPLNPFSRVRPVTGRTPVPPGATSNRSSPAVTSKSGAAGATDRW